MTTIALSQLRQQTAINEQTDVFNPAAGVTDFACSKAHVPASLKVFVNGVLQALAEDYTVAGEDVKLARPSEAGDVVQLNYRF